MHALAMLEALAATVACTFLEPPSLSLRRRGCLSDFAGFCLGGAFLDFARRCALRNARRFHCGTMRSLPPIFEFSNDGVRMRRSVALLRALGRARRRRDDAARSYATIRGAAVRFVDLRRAKKGEILKFRSQMINVK